MQEFLTTPKCRRSVLLHHFEPNNSSDENNLTFKKNCCDNCTLRISENGENKSAKPQMIDLTQDGLRLFKAIRFLNCRFGVNTIIGFLIASVCL